MTQPSNPNDFSQPSQPNPSKSSNILIWVFGCLGCGFFGIIIVGILAAIVLPTFLSQAGKAKQSEAKAYIESMTRAQQAYRLEKPKFANTLKDLDLGILPETKNYRYWIVPQSDPSKSVIMTAQPKVSGLKSYTSAVFMIKKGTEDATIGGVCESNRPSVIPPEPPTLPKTNATEVECPPGSRLLIR